MATYPRDNEDWLDIWRHTGHFYAACRKKVERNRDAMMNYRQRILRRTPLQTLTEEDKRQDTGKYYRAILQEMIVSDPRKQLPIEDLETVLMPAISVERTTDEIPRTKRTYLLTQFHQDEQGRWCYIEHGQTDVHTLINKAIDAYVHELDTIPTQSIRIASTNMLHLFIEYKLRDDIYQDERGSFTLISDPHVDVDTVVFG